MQIKCINYGTKSMPQIFKMAVQKYTASYSRHLKKVAEKVASTNYSMYIHTRSPILTLPDMCHNGLIHEWIYNDDVVLPFMT